MKYKICVPLQVKSSNIGELQILIDKVLRDAPDLMEFRFDYIDEIQSITPQFVDELISTVQSKVPIIFTLRDHKEGGKIKMGNKKRLEFLKTLILSQPNYLDIEMNTEKNVLTEIINLAFQNKVNLIFSYHDFDKTPSFEDVTHQAQMFINRLSEDFDLDTQKVEHVIIKMIFTAKSFEDNFIPLKLCKEILKKRVQAISFCMGSKGIFSRIMCLLNGSFFTYGSIVEETAPGQISIYSIREALKMFKLDG
ncbi:MAG: type I 3-dehydroquinate dehydratase [Promethearchaeota archaeon]|jgi:3-dehydroquinate dehydratase-1